MDTGGDSDKRLPTKERMSWKNVELEVLLF